MMDRRKKSAGFGISATFEGFLYYLSAMIGFNIIYALKIVGTNFNDNKIIPCHQKWFFIILFIVILVSVAIATYIIRGLNDEISGREKGIEIKISPNDNITSEIFFNSYSMFVITALSLPNFNNIFDIAIYLVVFITLGVIYISNEMFHINPTISFFGYKYYRVKSEEKISKSYTLIAPKNKIQQETTLNTKEKFGNIIKLR